ncbi:MAG: prenyltransferase/squalene oxidase repeat-containing protein [Promethearchaeota archaeon]
MVDVQKAIEIIQSHGTDVQKSRLAYILGKSSNTSIVEQYLEKFQLPSGGFPYNQKLGNPYCLSVTTSMMKIMAELKLMDTPLCERTVTFVNSVQNDSGYWDENPELEPLNPPFWDKPGDLNTQLWITGALADTLTRLRQGSSFHVAKAADFLLKHRMPSGAFKGFRHTTWLAIAVLAPLRGQNDHTIQSALGVLGSFGDWETNDLNWALDCLFWGGILAANEVVSALLARLQALQRPDGYWKSSDNADDLASQTLESLINLAHFSCI